MEGRNTFADRVREARIARGLTQSQAAERCGRTQQHWAWIESGRRYAKVLGALREIGDALGVQDYRELLPP